MFLLLPMLLSQPAGAGEDAVIAVTITEWKAYAPGLAAPAVEREVHQQATMCAEKYSITEFDELLFNLRFGAEENVVTLIEPSKLNSRAVVRCIRDEMSKPLTGQPSDTRGSVDLIIRIGE